MVEVQPLIYNSWQHIASHWVTNEHERLIKSFIYSRVSSVNFDRFGCHYLMLHNVIQRTPKEATEIS